MTSHQFAKFGGHRHCGSRLLVIILADFIIRPRDGRVMQHYALEPTKVNYHLAKCGGCKLCGSENIMILICLVISQGYVIEG